jgi:ankyrin repeat protein
MMDPLLDESELAEFELACHMGELHRVRGYLESDCRDALINMRFANGDTPLLAASISMRYPLVEYLLSCGADPNISDTRTISVLHGAVASRSLLAMQVFLAYGARTEMRIDSELGLTALHGAVIEEWEEGLQLLIEYGADINAISSMGATALCIACCQAAPNRIIELLLDGHASPELRNERGLSALHICVTQPDRLMKIFIDRGVSLEIRNAAGQSVLHFAVLEACASMCELLLAAGADIESVDNRERTMLIAACKANRPQAVEFLLKKGVTVDDGDYRGRTALHYAAHNLSLELVRMLAEANAEWTIHDNDGRAPLELAREVSDDEQFENFECGFHEAMWAEHTDDCVCMELRKSPLLKCSRCTDGQFHWTCMDRWVRSGKRAACWICRNELEEYPKDAHIPIDVRMFISFLASAGIIESEDDAEVYIEDLP